MASAFSRGGVKTIGIRYVRTHIVSKSKPIFVYKNIRIRVYGALINVQCQKYLPLSIVNGSIHRFSYDLEKWFR